VRLIAPVTLLFSGLLVRREITVKMDIAICLYYTHLHRELVVLTDFHVTYSSSVPGEVG
jgi:hypothetical protein